MSDINKLLEEIPKEEIIKYLNNNGIKVVEDLIEDSSHEGEKNYIRYDDQYLGSGYFIITKKDNKIKKFFKIYAMSENRALAEFGVRAYEEGSYDDPNYGFRDIEFSFDEKDGKLYESLINLDEKLNGKSVKTIDSTRQGKNNFRLERDDDKLKLIVSKDIYNGNQHPTDYIDIHVGDMYTCKNYRGILSLFQAFKRMGPTDLKEKELKEILKLEKNKIYQKENKS